VLEELRGLGPVEAVYGNMDEPDLRSELPKELVLEVEDAKIGVVHIGGPSAGRAERLARRFPGCAAVVYGHSHLPEVTDHGGVWILNPGSPTDRRKAPTHTMLRLIVEAGRVRPELIEVT
jgi:putative phosphoesterase